MKLICKQTDCNHNKMCVCGLEEITLSTYGTCEQRARPTTTPHTFWVPAYIERVQAGSTLEQAQKVFAATNPEYAKRAEGLELGYLKKLPKHSRKYLYEANGVKYGIDSFNTPKAVAVWYMVYDQVTTY